MIIYQRKYCPVALHKTNSMRIEDFGTIPVLFGEHIYFLKDENSIKQFLVSPKYFLLSKPPQPMLFPTVCILGDVKSGKTTLAEGLSKVMNAVYLTVPIILQAIIDSNEATTLCEQVFFFN
jgi:adenylate/nucleoside-diphosphate kinase